MKVEFVLRNPGYMIINEKLMGVREHKKQSMDRRQKTERTREKRPTLQRGSDYAAQELGWRIRLHWR